MNYKIGTIIFFSDKYEHLNSDYGYIENNNEQMIQFIQDNYYDKYKVLWRNKLNHNYHSDGTLSRRCKQLSTIFLD